LGTIEQINVTPLISNLSDTQQRPCLLLLFCDNFYLDERFVKLIESRPQWAQYLTIPNLIAHFVQVMRPVLWKGSNFSDVAWNFKVTLVLALVFNTLAVFSYRKQQ